MTSKLAGWKSAAKQQSDRGVDYPAGRRSLRGSGNWILTTRGTSPKFSATLDGVVAQLVEHHNGIVGVRGSNPLGSTILKLGNLPRPKVQSAFRVQNMD